jgi:ATP-dependent Lon protease
MASSVRRRARGMTTHVFPEYPVLPLKETVVFPKVVTPLLVGRERSLHALDDAMNNGQLLVVLAQKDDELGDPQADHLYTIGTLVEVGRLARMPDGATNIMAQGRQRVKVMTFTQHEPYFRAQVMPLYDEQSAPLDTAALIRAVRSLFEQAKQLGGHVPDDLFYNVMHIENAGELADLAASALTLDVSERQDILETLDPAVRLQKMHAILSKEVNVMELEQKIHAKVHEEMDKSQREYFLREQMRIIQNELHEGGEASEVREKLAKANLPEEVMKKAAKELERLAQMPPASPEIGVIYSYLDWLIELPWSKTTEDNLDMLHVAQILDKNHYGLKKVKERILEHIAVRKLAQDHMKTPILCFTGPPGTGKTSLGQSIAEALGRKFVRVSLGGVHDEAEIRGHRRTYIGSLPGRIIQTMRRAETINPIFMLDEIDKLGHDYRGDPAAALLEVLDPEQNHAFSDHYLDVPYDLSKVMFITTANWMDTVPWALLDRLEVINFPGYTELEKIKIARTFLIPKQLKENGVKDVRFNDATLKTIIREYTYESGVRNLDRELATICRKVARRVAEDKSPLKQITASSLLKLLGPPHYQFGVMEEEDQVGLAMGLVWSSGGGDTMPVEVSIMEGKGNLQLTGQLGEVMQESAQAALSYARSHAKDLNITANFDRLDIHIHIPDNAVAKDGPSGGITLATALISALLKRPVRRDVAMTGEITLRGRVLPIGGLKEKALAAHRAGIKKVIIPHKNLKDMMDIPRRIQREVAFVPVKTMDEVLPLALIFDKKPADHKPILQRGRDIRRRHAPPLPVKTPSHPTQPH